MESPQRFRTCWLLWLSLNKSGVGGSGGYPACPPRCLISVGNGETPSREAGSYLGPGAEKGRSLVLGPCRGSRAPRPAAPATSPAPSRR